MKVLHERIKQRRNNFRYYKNAFSGIGEIMILEEPDLDYYSNHWLTAITLEQAPVSREDIRLALVADNIDSRPLWKPMHMQPVFADAPFYGNGRSENIFERGLCLPSGSNLTENDLQRVVSKITEVFKLTVEQRF
jgi:dTDP-4-amino-4,6-dideoxygalactose transaminase